MSMAKIIPGDVTFFESESTNGLYEPQAGLPCSTTGTRLGLTAGERRGYFNGGQRPEHSKDGAP